ncbi:hypothetical protein EFP_218 [Enterococcus phage EF24C]|uniref:Uncharacterized protein n=5 Tax=Kochikohdavirus TaxID=2560160 RepID=A8E2S0_BPPHE|nr:hypothetical protein EFP_gp218 [Enterococcus phage EF24C]YP_009147122.1 hypothetical protein [Enterococcus phage ECP3]QBZ70084.1 hypothetical protein [Enterococcus phage vB_EfaM_Ef2.3]USL84276.1 hypothetical protein Sw5_12 [Enterococcus phage Sw5]WDQ27862.1 hypothetical protein EF53_237 [Enterococcus phage 53]CAD0301518.1 Phage protein [Enterococcus phage 156]AII28481.1 hypothetical protein [Enterococcus phage ECP3]
MFNISCPYIKLGAPSLKKVVDKIIEVVLLLNSKEKLLLIIENLI